MLIRTHLSLFSNLLAPGFLSIVFTQFNKFCKLINGEWEKWSWMLWRDSTGIDYWQKFLLEGWQYLFEERNHEDRDSAPRELCVCLSTLQSGELEVVAGVSGGQMDWKLFRLDSASKYWRLPWRHPSTPMWSIFYSSSQRELLAALTMEKGIHGINREAQ